MFFGDIFESSTGGGSKSADSVPGGIIYQLLDGEIGKSIDGGIQESED